MRDIQKLLKTLHDGEIEFVIVGGFAAVVHGSDYTTHDIDICALVQPEMIVKLRKCLAPYHPVHRMTPQKHSFLTIPEDISRTKNIYLNTDIGPLDILSEILGVGGYDDLIKNCFKTSILNVPCRVISIDDLITTKKLLGREKDLTVAKELELIRSKKK